VRIKTWKQSQNKTNEWKKKNKIRKENKSKNEIKNFKGKEL